MIHHGIGIAEDEVPRLFSRYGRTSGAVASGIEDHSLGMFLSKVIVDAHGGSIWAESPGAGAGTLVVMVLPRASQCAVLSPDGDGADDRLAGALSQ